MISKCQESLWVLSLGAGTSQVPLIKAASESNFKILAVDKNSKAEGFAFASEILVCSTHDPEALLKKMPDRQWSAVLCRSSGQAVISAAIINQHFGLSGINYKLAEISTSKSNLREFCSENEIKMPIGKRIDPCRDLLDLSIFHKNVVVKPDFTLVGKKEIRKLNIKRDEYIIEAVNLAAKASGNGFVEIEEFIEGYDCSFLFWVDRGTIHFLFGWDELINFDADGRLISVGLSTPSKAISSGHLKQILKITHKFCSKFPSVSSILAFSFRVDSLGNCWLIELHADLTGDLILDKLAPSATGFDFLNLITTLILNGFMTKEVSTALSKVKINPTSLLYRHGSEPLIISSETEKGLHQKIKNSL